MRWWRMAWWVSLRLTISKSPMRWWRLIASFGIALDISKSPMRWWSNICHNHSLVSISKSPMRWWSTKMEARGVLVISKSPMRWWRGGVLAVSGSSWIEVNSVTNLNIIEILDSDENELPLDSYVMTADDRLLIIEVIKDFIEGNIEASQPANSYYNA